MNATDSLGHLNIGEKSNNNINELTINLKDSIKQGKVKTLNYIGKDF